ncbi:hypothetical protein CWI37_0531p0010 [Hamiltosporidium tvaerminnensis]|uniref:Uncharacterized protein n=1 Tax=Hamiltosporidium tvaerminnensis TaxID=1176355 RepID=A0A4Q9L3V3_9MICR|nr:hypothetical protein CWI37_0531p0010 [Hamiltosporidium tvaerminnensis]
MTHYPLKYIGNGFLNRLKHQICVEFNIYFLTEEQAHMESKEVEKCNQKIVCKVVLFENISLKKMDLFIIGNCA